MRTQLKDSMQGYHWQMRRRKRELKFLRQQHEAGLTIQRGKFRAHRRARRGQDV